MPKNKVHQVAENKSERPKSKIIVSSRQLGRYLSRSRMSAFLVSPEWSRIQVKNLSLMRHAETGGL